SVIGGISAIEKKVVAPRARCLHATATDSSRNLGSLSGRLLRFLIHAERFACQNSRLAQSLSRSDARTGDAIHHRDQSALAEPAHALGGARNQLMVLMGSSDH